MNKMNIGRLVASIICTAILALFAIFVWPTRYRYEHTSFLTPNLQLLIRIDRFTDEVNYIDPSEGWKSIKGQTKADKALNELLEKDEYKILLSLTPDR